MEGSNPTRSELLARRAQIRLAQQGRDLLEEKRTALWRELKSTLDEAVRSGAELEAANAEARRALAVAVAHDGREAVQSAAFAARRPITIDVTAANVVGVQVPIIERKRLVRTSLERGGSLVGRSSRIDTAAARGEALLEQVIAVAAIELRVRRLAEEIERTSVRVNALETVVLPRLEAQHAAIARVLEEREREDLFRLKRVKARLASGRQASADGDATAAQDAREGVA